MLRADRACDVGRGSGTIGGTIDGMDDEVPLRGGFSTVVVRSGQTVRRTASPWTPSVHALLRRSGVQQVPVPLGFDDRGREVLEHVGGTVAWWPWPAVLRTDQGLCQVADLVRRLAVAMARFVEPADAVWHDSAPGPGPSVLRHGDLGPWNTLWRDGELVALIDWDTVAPAPAGWDAAQAAWFFVPLRPATGYRADEPGFTDADVDRRFALWCRALQVEAGELLGLVADVQEFDRRRLLERGRAGVEPYATFLARGDVEGIEQDQAFLADRTDQLLQTVAAGDSSGREDPHHADGDAAHEAP